MVTGVYPGQTRDDTRVRRLQGSPRGLAASARQMGHEEKGGVARLDGSGFSRAQSASTIAPGVTRSSVAQRRHLPRLDTSHRPRPSLQTSPPSWASPGHIERRALARLRSSSQRAVTRRRDQHNARSSNSLLPSPSGLRSSQAMQVGVSSRLVGLGRCYGRKPGAHRAARRHQSARAALVT